MIVCVASDRVLLYGNLGGTAGLFLSHSFLWGGFFYFERGRPNWSEQSGDGAANTVELQVI